MDLSFSEEQLLFRDAVRGVLQKDCGPDVLRAAWSSSPSCSTELWAKLAELCVFGVLVPEVYGGLGMSAVDHVLALEECGRAGVPGPVIETSAVAVPLLLGLGDAALATQWLPRIAAGEARVAVSVGDEPLVPDADTADLLLLYRGGSLFAVSPSEVSLTHEPSVDGARRLVSIDASWSSLAPIARGEQAARLATGAFQRGALGTAAQLVGLSRRMLEMTVEYVKARTQFGKPIGSFQAVKHHLTNALLPLEMAAPVVYRAAYSVSRDEADQGLYCAMAKALASEAAMGVARAALQCHGAIGYSFEHDLHLFMKRAWALAASWGSAAQHRARVGDVILGEPEDPRRMA